jgi:hypothetical protein
MKNKHYKNYKANPWPATKRTFLDNATDDNEFLERNFAYVADFNASSSVADAAQSEISSPVVQTWTTNEVREENLPKTKVNKKNLAIAAALGLFLLNR